MTAFSSETDSKVPVKGPRIPQKAMHIEHNHQPLRTFNANHNQEQLPPPAKICLQIVMDTSYGHIQQQAYGDILLVDKAQARRLAAVLMEYAGEPQVCQPSTPQSL